MKKINLQAGHQNAKNNCIVSLRTSTGAPGEAEFTVRIRDRVSQILLTKKNTDGTQAFQVQLVDACFNCDPKSDDQDYDLFLALHYDAYINGSIGGFADYPEPSTDGATVESQRITKAFNEEYFKHSGIKYVNRSNANTRYYYMWKSLSAKTPCVLLECGTGQNPTDSVILADTDRIANAIVRSICTAFNVPFDSVQPVPPAPPQLDYKKLWEDEVVAHQVTRDKAQVAVDQAVKPLQTKIDNAKNALA
jgi:hypothetical protein